MRGCQKTRDVCLVCLGALMWLSWWSTLTVRVVCMEYCTGTWIIGCSSLHGMLMHTVYCMQAQKHEIHYLHDLILFYLQTLTSILTELQSPPASASLYWTSIPLDTGRITVWITSPIDNHQQNGWRLLILYLWAINLKWQTSNEVEYCLT